MGFGQFSLSHSIKTRQCFLSSIFLFRPNLHLSPLWLNTWKADQARGSLVFWLPVEGVGGMAMILAHVIKHSSMWLLYTVTLPL